MRPVGWFVSLLCVLVLMLMAVSSASAAPTWLAPAEIGEGPELNECPGRVAMDSNGEAVAEWATKEGVQLASRPPGGPWHYAPAVAFGSAVCPEAVASDAQGDAVALWDRSNGTDTYVEYSLRPHGGEWEAPVTLVAAASTEVMPADVAFDPKGDAIAIVRWDGNHEIYSWSKPAGVAAWQPAEGVTDLDEAGDGLRVAMDPQGDATAVWQRVAGGHETVMASVRPAGGTWVQAAVSAEAAEVAGNRPDVAMTPSGEAVAVFGHAVGSGVAVQAARRLPSGSWQLPVTISEPSQTAERPQVATDPFGDAVAVWEQPEGKEALIESAWRPTEGSWQPPVAISMAGESAKRATVAMDAHGDALAAWTRSNGTHEVVQGATRPSGGAWRTPLTLSSSSENAYIATVAFDPAGDGLALWEGLSGGTRELEAAGYDGAAPTLGTITIPATAVAGQPVRFSGSASGVWTAIGNEDWSFGDGTSGSGGTVTHAYAAPGTYGVTFTALDEVGNAQTYTGTIVVSPAAAPRPSLTSLRQTHGVWREGTAHARITRASHRAPVGTTFSFTLDEPAGVTLAFTQPETGRRVGHRCERTTRGNRHARHCTLTATRGTLSFHGHAGTNRVAFQGRLVHSRLAPGTYTLVATASSGGLVSAPQRITFTIQR